MVAKFVELGQGDKAKHCPLKQLSVHFLNVIKFQNGNVSSLAVNLSLLFWVRKRLFKS